MSDNVKSVIINADDCIGCGKCVNDCVSEKIKLKNGKAVFEFDHCIECGHCYAICPVGAVKLSKYDIPEELPLSMREFDSDKLLLAMKSRRTIRKFKNVPVSDELVEKIIEAGRYSPTGTNAQNVSYTVMRDILPEAEKEAVKIFRFAQKAATPFSDYIKSINIDDNFFFKGAPVVILVNSSSETSACLASSYMELMAESLGLGVLYSGFFVGAVKFSRKLSSMIDTEKGHNTVTCLVIGYPDVEYQRIPPRKPAKVKMI